MERLPLFAQLQDRACLVVGGGTVAERRVRLLLEAGAAVTVLTRKCESAELRALAAGGRIVLTIGDLAELDVEPFWLVVAATDDRAANAEVARAAEVRKRFCNVVDDPALCTFAVPAIVERGPVAIAIGSGSPALSRWIKGWVESRLPARLGAFAALAARFRERVHGELPDAVARRRFWERAVESEAADHSYAGRDQQAEAALERQLADWATAAPAMRAGEAYLVGAGPGAADLITLRGRQLLATADVVLYDRLVGPDVLAFARRDAELVSVGKTPERPSITQKQINRLLVRLVRSGKRVCRLKGGDPFVFGRGGEELEALVEAALPFQIVPGISAAEGCAAYAGIPLTLRGVSRAVLLTTGQTEDERDALVAGTEPGHTLVLYMGVARYGRIAALLIERGHAPQTPVAVVESGTTENQRVVRTVLGSLDRAQAALGIRAPALLLVGETTRYAERYAWFAPSRIEFYEAEPTRTLARVSY